VTHRAGDNVVFDGRVTKNADLFAAWRYVAAVPRLPKKFPQPFPTYDRCDRDRADDSANGRSGGFCRKKASESNSSPMKPVYDNGRINRT
jgi:hypothetical protein